MKKKIAIISGSRSEFGLLENLIFKLNLNKKFKTNFIVTGSHLDKKFGNTIKYIKKNKININHKIKISTQCRNESDILFSLSKAIKKFTLFLQKKNFDLVIILGDRWEIFGFGIAASFLKIPIAHIHGGELTRGLIDDHIRHSLTKMSFFHFVSTKIYRNRIIRMGESPNRVLNVGALAGDNLKNFKPIKKDILEKKIKIKINSYTFLVTFHPETLSTVSKKTQIITLIKALKKLPKFKFIFSFPGVEAGSNIFIDTIQKECKKANNFHYFKSMGQTTYYSMIYYCAGMIGNSSSGILEAPYFNKINFNIGERQSGRVQAGNTINIPLSVNKIKFLINKFYKKKINVTNNPYGNGNAIDKIINYLEKTNIPATNQKVFYN